MATIDVLLPVKNGIDYLAASLESVMGQTLKDWRLLVLDHGSTDGSREMVEKYSQSDSRIQLFSFPDANGLADLLNHGLDIADCKYVMRHDADDVCQPDRMAISLSAFEQYPQCIAIGGQVNVIDGEGAYIGPMSLPVGIDRVAASSLFRNPVAHPTVMMDFSAIQSKGIRYGVDFLQVLPPQESLLVNSLAEDYFLFGQLAILGQCANVPQTLIQYRWHGGNVGAKKYREQMLVSVEISRFLMRSLCAIKGIEYADPAPFCNLGDSLFNVTGVGDLNDAFEKVASILHQAFGCSSEVERELAFRHVVSTRSDLLLLWRFAKFKMQHRPDTGEWNAVKSWLTRNLPGKSRMSIPAQSTLQGAHSYSPKASHV